MEGESVTEANDSVNQADDQNGSSGSTEAEGQSQDTVKYDTYRKVLSEKKRRDEEVRELREKVEAYERSQKEAQEKDLEDQNKWKEIADLRAKEASQYKHDLESMRESQRQAMKLDNFLSALGSNLPKQYWGLVDLDAIKLNPETNEVDDMSVTSAIETFRKSYPEILQSKTSATTPNTAPRGTAAATRGERDMKDLPAKERNKLLAADLIELKRRR